MAAESHHHEERKNNVKIYSLYDRPKGPVVVCKPEESEVQQNQKDECDINMILKRFEQTGELTHTIQRDATYGDFASAPTYQEALNTVIKAQDQFSELNAHIRARFGNDPEQFLEFCNDPKNKEEMKKMGLLKKQEEAPSKALPPKDPPPDSK